MTNMLMLKNLKNIDEPSTLLSTAPDSCEFFVSFFTLSFSGQPLPPLITAPDSTHLTQFYSGQPLASLITAPDSAHLT